MIKTKQIILNESINPVLLNFFRKTFAALGNEFNKIASDIYLYPDKKKGIDDKDSINDVFSLIERTYVGILNNAILRTFPQDSTLQEFPVYGKKGFKGRADFLTVHNYAKGKFINLLFEAKAGVFSWKDYTQEETSQYYSQLHKQALGYYEAERSYYEAEIYTVAITFDWIRNMDLLATVLKEPYSDNVTDFYFIYYTSESGMSVSGSVRGPF